MRTENCLQRVRPIFAETKEQPEEPEDPEGGHRECQSLGDGDGDRELRIRRSEILLASFNHIELVRWNNYQTRGFATAWQYRRRGSQIESAMWRCC